MPQLRLAVVTDIHHGRDTLTKKGSQALPLLGRFVDEVNAGGFDAVLDLGDRISDESAEHDTALQSEVAAVFARLTVPHHHISGNHDHATLDAVVNEAILGGPTGSRALVLGGVRLVFWQPDVSLSPPRSLRLTPGDLDVLAELLNADARPTLLVSHVPLSGHAQTGNYYFEQNPGHAAYPETADIRRVIASAPCPIVALAGHVHWNTLTTVDGTPHLTLQSLTESFISGAASGCWAILAIDGDEFSWTVGAAEPVRLVLPWRATKVRWRAPAAALWAEREATAA